jgi:uncharacterized protein (DUF2236 family)
MANNIITKVNHIHTKITGLDEFGKPYSATDPHLLAWVHLTETRSFINSFEDYRKEKISPKEKDQYFLEMSSLGERMGAVNLPATYANTEKAIQGYIPELYFGERVKSIIDLLDNFPSNLTAKPFIKLISRAGFLNLPDWVYPMIGKPTPSYFERLAVKKSIDLIAIPIREALKNGVAAHSLRRVYG